MLPTCPDERPVQKRNLPLTFDFLITLRLLIERKTLELLRFAVAPAVSPLNTRDVNPFVYLTCAALPRP